MAFDAIETPFGKTNKIIGGAATYIGLAASYFFKNINMVSVVGEDFPNESMDMLKKHGLKLDGVQVKMGQKSFFWSGRYHTDMNSRDTLATELNVLADFDPVVPENCREVEFLMLGNLMPSIQQKVMSQLKKRPKLIVLDTMNFWMDTAYEDETGLAQIESEVARLSRAYADAQASGDRAALNAAARDLRYWTARRASAELVPASQDAGEVRFGARVTFVREDGRQQTYRIVGEDEADPAKGTLSYVSPLARALLGKAVGDTARVGAGEVEILSIS